MDQSILVNEEIDSGSDLAHAFNAIRSVAAAFWLKPAEADRWYLYLASPEVNFENLHDAYREILGLTGLGKKLWLDPFQVKLINADHPLARKVIEIRDLSPARIPIRYNGTWLAGEAIDGAYIYPRIETSTTAV
ncbi:hypothetical protein GC170_00200 [bacterium]|nr:hypothetical protein [bacterium]